MYVKSTPWLCLKFLFSLKRKFFYYHSNKGHKFYSPLNFLKCLKIIKSDCNSSKTFRLTRSSGRACMCSNDHECPICIQMYQNPIVTNCGHVICERCLVGTKICPVCHNPLIKNLFMAYSKMFQGTKAQNRRILMLLYGTALYNVILKNICGL